MQFHKNLRMHLFLVSLLGLALFTLLAPACEPPAPAAKIMIEGIKNCQVVLADTVVTVTAAEDISVAKLSLSLDGTEVLTGSNVSLTYDIAVANLDNGAHTLSAIATDSSGATYSTEMFAFLLAKGSQEVVYDSGELKIPMTYTPNAEVDVKAPWTMPANQHKIIALNVWQGNDWDIEYAIGTGICPHSGESLASAQNMSGMIEVSYENSEPLDAVDWFAHIKPMNAAEHRGDSLSYCLSAAVFE